MIALMTVTLKLEMLQVNVFVCLLQNFLGFWCVVARLTYGRWDGASELLGLGLA